MKKNREHKIATEYKKVITENLKIQLKFQKIRLRKAKQKVMYKIGEKS